MNLKNSIIEIVSNRQLSNEDVASHINVLLDQTLKNYTLNL